jgi:hypothetical protein
MSTAWVITSDQQTVQDTPEHLIISTAISSQAINNTPPQKPGKKRHANRDTSRAGQSPRTNHSTTNSPRSTLQKAEQKI